MRHPPGQGTNRRRWGIVGGLGPRVSAEFTRTIYEHNLNVPEQDSPIVFLYSDPTLPDRTQHLVAGNDTLILEWLVTTLQQIAGLGSTHVVLCCMTLHALLPRVPLELRRTIVSLVDVVLERVAATDERHLLACTSGTRRLRIFEQHPLWNTVADKVVLLDEHDQHAIHCVIYDVLKANRDVARAAPIVASMLERYGLRSLIVGCTELHLLSKHAGFLSGQTASYRCVDPLTIIATELMAEHSA